MINKIVFFFKMSESQDELFPEIPEPEISNFKLKDFSRMPPGEYPILGFLKGNFLYIEHEEEVVQVFGEGVDKIVEDLSLFELRAAEFYVWKTESEGEENYFLCVR